MKLLILDNYDSFTYNLVHLIKELGVSPVIARNDKISLEQVAAFDKILLSPGPGVPSEAGIMPELISRYAPEKSILGICLGHQGIAESFGGTLYNLTDVYHGVATATKVVDRDSALFKDVPDSVLTCRYHSWAVKSEGLPDVLQVTAVDEEGNIMGIRHRRFDVEGLQFHPESYLTQYGRNMIANWLGK